MRYLQIEIATESVHYINRMAELPSKSTSSRRKKSQEELVKQHECLHCFQRFATAYHLKRHSIVHSTEKKFNCQFCESSFRLLKELVSHESTHKRTLADINFKRCRICGRAFHSDKLFEHFKEHDEHYECDLCNKVYQRKHHLKLHMTTHINAREFQCSICSKAFNFLSQIKRHELSHTTTAVWYCEVCGVGFKNKPNLVHHMRSHNGEKPFQCDLCDRCFSSKQSLQLHTRIHKGEKPYKCPWEQCGRCFHDSATLKVHARLHTNENPYECHLCGKTTKQASNLKSHYLHAHKIQDITSKTIRLNARLNAQQCKKENSNDNSHFETVNAITARNERDISNQTEIDACNQISLGQFHVRNVEPIIETKINTVQSEESRKCDVYDVVYMSDNVQPVPALKEEVSFSYDNIPHDEDSVREEIADTKPFFKQEAFITDSSILQYVSKTSNKASDPLSFKTVESDKNRHTTNFLQRKAIEEVYIVQENKSISLLNCEVKQEIVKDENSQLLTIKTEASVCDNEIQQERSEEIASSVEVQSDMIRSDMIRSDMIRSDTNSQQSSTLNLNDKVVVKVMKLQKLKRDDKPIRHQNNLKCSQCPLTFKLESKLRHHMNSHTKMPNDKMKICELCGKSFKQFSVLQKHFKSTHSNFRPFSCTLCDRSFKDSHVLKVHLRSHSGEKPYNCSFCPKSFSTSMGKKLHQRVHTGEKPYQCQYCESAFSDNSTYRQHVRIHTGEKPYVCYLCGKGTTQAGNLKSHLRHAHKIQIKNVKMTKT